MESPFPRSCLFFLSALSVSLHAQERLACLGNSITEGEGTGYVEMLADSLGSGWTTGNFGSSGKTALRGVGSGEDGTYWGCDRLVAAFAFHPTIVTIKFGTNDSKTAYWPQHKNEFVPDYCALIDTVRTMTSVKKVYICKPCPAFDSWGGEFQPTVIHNEVVPLIDSIAKLRNCPVIDCHTPLLNKSSYFPDGVHPGPDGCEALAGIFYRALTSTTEAKSPAATPLVRSCSLQRTSIWEGRTVAFHPNGANPAKRLFDTSGRWFGGSDR